MKIRNIFDFIEKGINFPLGFSVEKLTSKWNLADGNGGRCLYDGVINRDEIVSKAFSALVFLSFFAFIFFRLRMVEATFSRPENRKGNSVCRQN